MILNMPLEYLRELKTVLVLLTFKHLRTQQLAVFKHSVFFTMYFSFLVNTFLVFSVFFSLFHSVYILQSHYFRKCIGAFQLIKS